MRLLTFATGSGEHHTGLLRGRNILDLHVWLAQGKGWSGPGPDMLTLIEMGADGLALCREILDEEESKLQSLGAVVAYDANALLAPIPRPRKNIMCLGRNYPEHRAESMRAFGEAPQPPPDFPMFFTKATTTVSPPYADLHFDFSVTRQLDWEAELGFIIGTGGKNIKRMDSLEHIFGYVVINDLTARDLQKRYGNQYFKGKSLDNSCPMGPWIITADELPDPSILRVWSCVNGAEKQSGYTGDMYFDIPSIIETLSEGMTLEPGDIVSTGTPEGVGNARRPPEYLQPGDVVECGVDLVGAIKNRIIGA